jgi:hypothetical protein
MQENGQFHASTVTKKPITVPSEQDGNQSQVARSGTADRTSFCLDRNSGLSGFSWYTKAFLRFASLMECINEFILIISTLNN